MSSHRVTPNLDVQLRRTFRPLARAFAMLGKSISEAGALTRDDYTLTASLADEPVTPLWSPDPPSVPAGHVWTLPGVGTSKLERALWWGEPGNLRDNVHLIHLRLSQSLMIPPGGHGYSTSQSAEDQRAHEEDADD